MQLQITIEVWDKGKWFVATCPELDFMAQGPTREQARLNLLEVTKIQFQEMTANHTLLDYLSECGYVRQNGSFISFLPRTRMVIHTKKLPGAGERFSICYRSATQKRAIPCLSL